MTVPLTLGVSLKLVEVSESADIGLENVTLIFEFSGTLVALSAGLVEATVGGGVSTFGGVVLPVLPPQAAIQAMQRHE